MFGYITANKELLTKDQAAEYKSVYCGLCRALRQNHSAISGLTITYDMAFLVLVLSSMYEPETQAGLERCIPHPIKKHEWVSNEITDYAAAMNIALAYLKLLDDRKDEGKLRSSAFAFALFEEYNKVKASFPEKISFFEKCIIELSALEKSKSEDPDAAAACFGRLMGELFVYKKDEIWEDKLRDLGFSLGVFIYMMDAVIDLETDKENNNYNPLLLIRDDKSKEELFEILKMLMSDVSAKYEYLPLVKYSDILNNILYSGVWLKYRSKFGERQGEIEVNES
ncbi:MAG: hypothetical protein GX684_06705 [Ruminococcaceae bacterium]|nr:hypothetical protein [Oscillospiraceae bacterium]